jgi:hypothetical protein
MNMMGHWLCVGGGGSFAALWRVLVFAEWKAPGRPSHASCLTEALGDRCVTVSAEPLVIACAADRHYVQPLAVMVGYPPIQSQVRRMQERPSADDLTA